MNYEFKQINGCVDESILSPITYKSNEVEYILCITRDITKKKLYHEEYVGHMAFHDLLREFSIRLKKCMRSKDTGARIGGDEFTVLLPNLKDEEQVNAIALRMIQSMDDPWIYEDEKVFVTISIGLTWSDENSNPAEMLK